MAYNKIDLLQKSQKGISLVELVVYVALLTMFTVFIATSLLYLVTIYRRASAEREVLSNARLILETVGKEISSAQEIYAPTSRFNNDAGQVSLITAIGAPPGESGRSVDFWIDNGIFLTRTDGSGEKIISAPSVRITRFRPERIIQGLDREAIKLLLSVEYENPRLNASTTLNATFALRGAY